MKEKPIPRGLRNNNPGNIRHSKARWRGMRPVQEDPDFVQFRTMSYGYRAIFKIIRTYRAKYKVYSVSDIIRRWAPPIENNTTQYLINVCRQMGVSADFVPNVDRKDTMCSLVAAISFCENGKRAVMSEVEEGWDLLMEAAK